MHHFVYVGLEPYEERYTAQMSGSGGWFDRAAEEAGIRNILHIQGRTHTDAVATGKVLDAHGRCTFALSQMEHLVSNLRDGLVADNAIVFFEDMWHPGIEALAYVAALEGKRYQVYARCHAQSIDPHDFTFPMRAWMRHYERGLAVWAQAIFVASTCHVDQLVGAGIGPRERFVRVGLPFCSEEVYEHAGRCPWDEKEPLVVFTSRWDWEKQPWFYRAVAAEVCKTRPDIQFLATTSRPEASANFQLMCRECLGTPVVPRRVTKAGYYEALSRAKVQFNCALQDYVSNTLIEASAFGCVPVYPRFLSFPEALEAGQPEMYTPFVIEEAAAAIIKAVDSEERDNDAIYKYHDRTYQRIFEFMRERRGWL